MLFARTVYVLATKTLQQDVKPISLIEIQQLNLITPKIHHHRTNLQIFP